MTVNKSGSVIFVLGHAQNLILPQLLESIDDEVVKVFSVFPGESGGRVDFISIKPSNFLGLIAMILKVLKCIRCLDNCAHLKIFAPHLLNFMANKIYYRYVGKSDFFYLFDGMLNYRNALATQGWLPGYQKKQKIKSWLIFHRYRSNAGLIVDESIPGVRGIYVPSGVIKDKIKFSRPVLQIDTLMQKFIPQARLLILEPPMGKEAVRIFQDKLSSLVREKYSGYEIFIKRHPSMQRSSLDLAAFQTPGGRVEMLETVSPAETVFCELECEAVVSSNSSALLMIKANCVEAHVYSIVCEEVNDQTMDDVEQVMRGAGVIFL